MPYNSRLGVMVHRATQVLGNPAAGLVSPRNMFTITGTVMVTQIVGTVTFAMDATPSTLQLVHLTGAVTTVLSVAVAAIASDGIGTIYTISGDFADLMYAAVPAAAGAIRGGMSGGLAAGGAGQKIANGILMIPGSIQEIWTGDQDGAIQWTIAYIPISLGATIVAVLS